MKILVTGGTGFVGENLHNKLSEDNDVYAIGSDVYDLRNQWACKKVIEQFRPDVIIHAAGSVGGIGANSDNPGKFMYDNLIMGANMIHMAHQFNISKFINLGTVCSYPKHTPVPFKETDIWNGYPEETNAPYGIAKRGLMQLIMSYNKQYGFNGINLVPVNMYGIYDNFDLHTSHVIPALIIKMHNAVLDQKPSVVLWGTGTASREFLFVNDLADAVILAIKKDPGPQPINIGTGNEITISDLASKIAGLVGFDGEIQYDDTKPDGQPRRCLDTTRARESLGFEATTNLDTGLKLTIDWFLENL